ncbi:MAG: phage tail length tape measure family protein [Klebsiella sp.]|nr:MULTISPECIES: phage tail length tape measure family protein [Klebsiella]MDU7528713.1 phage tail length tape measure family protein [Klebsiella sp.]
MINPLTLAAAAVGVLGLAYYKGTQEQDEFYKSLTLTGNLIGKTSGQLADIAARAGVAADSTTGKAASTLNLLVSSGKVAGDSLERVTTAIVKTSDATGIATDKLVGDFNDIAADPVAAITKLNDQYHFLTLATYNQIKALQDEGNQQEAARVASESYSATLIQRSNDIKENLGLLESAWTALGREAKSAWDAMLNVGREQTLEDKLKTLNESIAEAQKGQSEGGLWNGLNARFTNLPAMIKLRDDLEEQITVQDVLNDSIGTYNKRQQEGIEAQERINKLTAQTLTNAQRRKKALDDLTRDLARQGPPEHQSVPTRRQNFALISTRDIKTPKLPKRQRAKTTPKTPPPDYSTKLTSRLPLCSRSLMLAINSTARHRHALSSNSRLPISSLKPSLPPTRSRFFPVLMQSCRPTSSMRRYRTPLRLWTTTAKCRKR